MEIFTILYKGVKFIVGCIISKIVLLPNWWIGICHEGLSPVFALICFYENYGTDVNFDEHKNQSLDINFEIYWIYKNKIRVL